AHRCHLDCALRPGIKARAEGRLCRPACPASPAGAAGRRIQGREADRRRDAADHEGGCPLSEEAGTLADRCGHWRRLGGAEEGAALRHDAVTDLWLFLPACFALNLTFGPSNLLSVTFGAQQGVGFAVVAGAARLAAFAPMIL